METKPVRSLLSGENVPRLRPSSHAVDDQANGVIHSLLTDKIQDLTRQIGEAKADIERLTVENETERAARTSAEADGEGAQEAIAAALESTRAAEAEALAVRVQLESVREELLQEVKGRVQAEGRMEGYKTSSEISAAALVVERKARSESEARFTAALAMKTTTPPGEPPSYEMQVTSRDGAGDLRSVRLVPIKKGT